MDRLMAAVMYLIVVAFIGALCFADGSSRAKTAAAKAEQQRTAQAVKAQKDADALVLANEQALRQADAKRFSTYQKDHEDADQKTERVVADLRADNRRLRVPVQRPVCAAAPDQGATTAEGTGDEGHAELTADASVFVVGLLKRGDDAISKHAAVVDLYENLRAACNKEITIEGTP